MTLNNPMLNTQTRKAVSEKLREIGHRPKVLGGNGRGPSKAEAMLSELFPRSVWNFVVKTHRKSVDGYPHHYKIDVAFPDVRLAVEADGGSHSNWHNHKAKDAKKDALLRGLGWKVLRFSNKEILRNPKTVQAAIECTISQLKTTPVTASKVV
jgi:very-short-patch-repair endonuclease